ncbi:MAG: hypothetical protein FJ390_01875 [Verrucomicrobia bacterium]|nr:hypothetical protein [Verrucomicrobiota bacterium]
MFDQLYQLAASRLLLEQKIRQEDNNPYLRPAFDKIRNRDESDFRDEARSILGAKQTQREQNRQGRKELWSFCSSHPRLVSFLTIAGLAFAYLFWTLTGL